MPQNTNITNEFDENIDINIKNFIYGLWSRKSLMITVFTIVFLFFVLLTFILPKKYLVDADLYINKSNNTNMAEINPYVIEELGGIGNMATLMSGNGSLTNEIELMQSPLVMDNVIRENNIRVSKFLGIIPTKKTGQYVKTENFIKKVHIENKAGTNVISIAYKAKDRELAYNVVNSIIKNYEELNRKIHSDKSESDLKILEDEYNKAKADMNQKTKNLNGLPASTMAGTGNIVAMSAFSKSAQKAMENLHSQYVTSEKSQLELMEDKEKVAQLATKLEWAKLVQNISDSSKVLVIKAPQQLKEYEQKSPKLLIQIILGIVFGYFAALIAAIIKENIDKKLTYLMLGNNIIYNIKKEALKIKALLVNSKDKIGFIYFDKINDSLKDIITQNSDVMYIKADISKEFNEKIDNLDSVILVEKIGITDSNLYKITKEILNSSNKEILAEVLL